MRREKFKVYFVLDCKVEAEKKKYKVNFSGSLQGRERKKRKVIEIGGRGEEIQGNYSGSARQTSRERNPR